MTVVSSREEFAADLAARLGGQSVRQLASISGWGRTTVADIRAGRQLPTPDQLRDLLMSVGADQAEVDIWQSRRSLLAPPPEPVRPQIPEEELAGVEDVRTPRSWRWLAGTVAALVLLATGFAGGFMTRDRTLRHAVAIPPTSETGANSAARSRTVDVAQGATHTCALTAGGAVLCWGRNDVGQLGDGTFQNSPRPVQVTGLLAGVKAVAAGGRISCAITYDDRVRCWGHNAYGQLGDGQETRRGVPVLVNHLPGPVSRIAVGMLHACILTRAGDAYCWGNGEHGQLGTGTFARASHEPVLVKGIDVQLTGIVAGDDFTCAWSIRQEVFCWGANAYGQLGIGSRTDAAAPVRLKAYPEGVTTMAAGGEHVCAIAPAGGVDCWGRGESGQLGDGKSADSSQPVPVTRLDKGTITLTAGLAHSCAANSVGGVYCWGDGSAGQLGLGVGTSSATPTLVPDLRSGGVKLVAGNESTCALGAEALWCWGTGRFGEVGAGAASSLARPHRIAVP